VFLGVASLPVAHQKQKKKRTATSKLSKFFDLLYTMSGTVPGCLGTNLYHIIAGHIQLSKGFVRPNFALPLP
jgi:hypothetical protein